MSTHQHVQELKSSKQPAAVTAVLWLCIVVCVLASLTVSEWLVFVPQLAALQLKDWMIAVGLVVVAFALFIITPQRKEFINYLRGVQKELVKVIWPTKNETLKMTWIVIAVVIVSSIFLSLVDKFFFTVIHSFINWATH